MLITLLSPLSDIWYPICQFFPPWLARIWIGPSSMWISELFHLFLSGVSYPALAVSSHTCKHSYTAKAVCKDSSKENFFGSLDLPVCATSFSLLCKSGSLGLPTPHICASQLQSSTKFYLGFLLLGGSGTSLQAVSWALGAHLVCLFIPLFCALLFCITWMSTCERANLVPGLLVRLFCSIMDRNRILYLKVLCHCEVLSSSYSWEQFHHCFNAGE